MFVIIGAGGHAKVIADILKENNADIAGFYDDHPDAVLEDFTKLGKISELHDKHRADYQYIIAIGNNNVRGKIARELKLAGYSFGKAIHPTAVIGSNVSIGEGTVIMANCVVNHSAMIGSNVIINTAATIDHDCVIGDYSHISPGANLAGNVTVGQGSQVGIGSSVIQALSIGANTVIGAGSAVIRSIPDNCVAAGCPAKIIKEKK